MQTSNQKIRLLVQEVLSLSESTFKERCLAIYIMGSLARGSFSEVASDIDIGIILDGPLRPQDGSIIDSVLSKALARSATVQNKVSIFWGSVDSINGVVDAGRYPPFDRLDLIDHALLLSGQDVRRNLIRPTKKELEISGAEFALDLLGSDERIEEFHNCSLVASKGTVYVTKTVLFPARFIYLERTGEIAGNDVSFQYYVDHFSGYDAALVQRAYQWRQESLPESSDEVVELLNKGLVPLYCRFIDIYRDCLSHYGEGDLSHRLGSWREAITKE